MMSEEKTGADEVEMPEIDIPAGEVKLDELLVAAESLIKGDIGGAQTLMGEACHLSPIERTSLIAAMADATGWTKTALKSEFGSIMGKKLQKDKDGAGLVSHDSYSRAILQDWTVEEAAEQVIPVGTRGVIWRYNTETCLWFGHEDISADVADRFAGQEHCKTGAHFKQISRHTYSRCERGNEKFFDDAPVGLATPSGFYLVTEDGILEGESLSHLHRQTSVCPVEPDADCPTPLYDAFLQQSYAIYERNDDGENPTLNQAKTDEQIKQAYQFKGAAVIGAAHKAQKVAFHKGPGKNGKGVEEKILVSMFSADVLTAVPVTSWAVPMYCAQMASSKLNVDGETNKKSKIPDGPFKKITGGGMISCRGIYASPYDAVITCAHFKAGQYYPYTIDRTDGFFRRWLMFSMPNRVSDRDEDTELAAKIIKDELPGVLYKSLMGAVDFVSNGNKYDLSPVHTEMMEEYAESHTPVRHFLATSSSIRLGEDERCDRALLWGEFKMYCAEAEIYSGNVSRFYEELTNLGFYFCWIGKRPNPGEPHTRKRGFKGITVLDYKGDVLGEEGEK